MNESQITLGVMHGAWRGSPSPKSGKRCVPKFGPGMSLPASRARCLLADQLGVQRRSRAVAAATRMASFAVVLLLQIQLCPAAIVCGSAGPKLFTSNNTCMVSSPELQQLKQLHDEGVINTSEFLRMTREVQEKGHEFARAPPSSPPPGQEMQEEDEDDEEEELGEDDEDDWGTPGLRP